jgi:hypothetical protein
MYILTPYCRLILNQQTVGINYDIIITTDKTGWPEMNPGPQEVNCPTWIAQPQQFITSNELGCYPIHGDQFLASMPT